MAAAASAYPALVSLGDDVVVWEYESDLPGLFCGYKDKVSNFIENKYQNKNTSAKLGDVDPALYTFEINFHSMQQFNQYGFGRKIRRKVFPHTSVLGKGITWQWQTDMDWVNYDSEALEALEDAYVKHQNILDLQNLSSNLPNKVMLDKMYQVNKRTGFFRPVRRVNASYASASRKKTNQQTKPKPVIPPRTTSASATAAATTKRKRANQVQTTSQNVDPSLKSFFNIATDVKDDDDCAICLCPYVGDDAPTDTIPLEFKKCKHKLHQTCALPYAKSQNAQTNSFIQCPSCKRIHGEKRGNQPPGNMDVRIDKNSDVDGYPGCGRITITYSFSNGIQGPNQPNPNNRYYAVGFPRTGYLPANDEGKKVLKLLKVAWERNLTFTIGTSVTTGRSDCVVWNEIHHKTSPTQDGSGHSYPDPNYLDNVKAELRQHGITEDDIS